MRIVYCPLEAYESRYTYQLREWNLREFKRLNIKHIVIDGVSLPGTSNIIETGQVLDAHQRSYYALSQVQKLVEMHYKGNLTNDDFIYFEDMFHPGIEALAYCSYLTEYSRKTNRFTPWIGVRCLAQTIDPDDFLHYTDNARWMRHYEAMVNSFVDIVFVASEEMLPFMTAAGWNIPVAVTGLSFGKQEILERVNSPICDFHERPLRVSFASRIADEKQPEFFLAIAEKYKHTYILPVIFEILSGGKISSILIDRAVIKGEIEVYPELTKEQYYAKLTFSRVLLNCSLQDWVSNTINEADTLGCNVLAPAYRSFPELFENDHTRMYVPWSVDDAVDKLHRLMEEKHPAQGRISDYQDKTIERTISIIADMMGTDSERELDNPVDTKYRRRIIEKVLSDRT
jgi:hypothetical protein